MKKTDFVEPFVKWVGGKRQLLRSIRPLLPDRIDAYCEPFAGGGAVFFAVRPPKAIVNDLNPDLISVYEVVRDDVDALIDSLKRHQNTPEYFYMLRNIDRDREAYTAMSKIEKASRLIYLNKTCYNGLFRVNASCEFNTPFGRYKKPNIVNERVLRAVSRYINDNRIRFYHEDFAKTLRRARNCDFVYLDPPYDPLSLTANFTSYNPFGFDRRDQLRLRRCCDAMTARGTRFLMSNSATDFIKELYGDYHMTVIHAKRKINADGGKRGAVEEVLIYNYSVI